ncbi:MAG: hypothetical protein AB7F65_04960 [Dehalococcoidia bacterium]
MRGLDELNTIASRQMGRRAVLRTFALGGAGIAAAAILGCSDDEDGAEAMAEESMMATATGEAMAEGSMTPTGTAMSGEMMEPHDHDLGAAKEFALVRGWYQGEEVTYYDFGMNSTVNPPAVTPAPIWAFIHGMDANGAPMFVEGQHNIVDVVPGDPGYSDLWQVNFVVVPEGYEADSITSAADLQAMSYETIQPGVLVNCPIVPAGSTLESGAELTQGWYQGARVYYPDFGMNPAVAIPIWVFVTGMDASGNPVFVEGQRNIIDAIPGDEGYSDFWHVRMVMVDESYEANSITSAEAVGDAGFEVVQAPLVVNCPVVPRA